MFFDEGQLKEYGRRLGAGLGQGAVVALVGGLGAGKTTLAKAIAEGLGVAETVTSPTFTLINEYASGRLPLYHFDLYRLGDGPSLAVENAMEDLGYKEYFFGGGATVVEWADLAPDLIPGHALWIELRHTEDAMVREVLER